LLVWRGSIIAAAMSLVMGLPAWISVSGSRMANESILSILAILLVGLFVVAPWLVRITIKKRFRSFSLVVVRKQAGSDT
jgi:hypothetical protein